ncbi:hypothetical protein OSB04_000297 [Centaurea solstitialis]|uniref:Uncharacterized protein n=1 Tax=Centaurea solstitialis TaxID=347529 RepID=A0AA38U1H3_9ASTR|nr:hypothetical protein OSB04_000297 [Centaurea solstitialis]
MERKPSAIKKPSEFILASWRIDDLKHDDIYGLQYYSVGWQPRFLSMDFIVRETIRKQVKRLQNTFQQLFCGDFFSGFLQENKKNHGRTRMTVFRIFITACKAENFTSTDTILDSNRWGLHLVVGSTLTLA